MIRQRAGLAETDDEATTRVAIRAMVAEHIPDEADRRWIENRLRALGADLVIATLSEKHALSDGDDDFQNMAFSDIWYSAHVSSDASTGAAGPYLEVRGRDVGDGTAPGVH